MNISIVSMIIKKTVDSLKKEDFFSNLKKNFLNDIQIERTKKIFKLFSKKNGEELTQLFLKK